MYYECHKQNEIRLWYTEKKILAKIHWIMIEDKNKRQSRARL